MEWWWTYKPPDDVSVLWRTVAAIRDIPNLNWVVPDAANHRLLYFNHLGIPQKENTVMLEGNFSPAGVCQITNHALWLSDWKSGSLECRSIFGHRLTKLEGLCSSPSDICVTRQGHLLVTDLASNIVFRLDPQGILINKIDLSDLYLPLSRGLRDFLPSYIDYCDLNDSLVMSDSDNNEVCVLDGEGKLRFFLSGTRLDQPYGVRFTPRGEILVADYANQRIARFDTGGRFVDNLITWKDLKPERDGWSWSPRSLAFDSRGDLCTVSCNRLYYDSLSGFRKLPGFMSHAY